MEYIPAKTIVTKVKAPANWFGIDYNMNIYKGCSHGCIYCDSRSKCYHMEHDFEDIEVKENAIDLLACALKRKRKKCMIGTGAMTDPYIPLEMEIRNVRKALQLIYQYGFGFTVITKSRLILRDLDLLQKINEKTKCVVQMTLTTYDEELCRILEPNVCTTGRRAQVLEILRDEGIPTVVWLSPILPFLNDTKENIEGILEYCVRARVRGIICFGMGMTLRQGDREYYYAALDRHFPGLRERYRRRYGQAYEVPSDRNGELMELFYRICGENGILCHVEECFAYLHEFPERYEQLTLF